MTRYEAAARHAACGGLSWHVIENPYRVGDVVVCGRTIATVVRVIGRVGVAVEGPFRGRRRRTLNIRDISFSRGQILLDRVEKNAAAATRYAEAMTGDPETHNPCGAV